MKRLVDLVDLIIRRPGTFAGVMVLSLSATLSAGLLGPTHAGLTLGVQGRANATPSIAADGSFVAIAWSGALPDGATDVFVATSRDGGKTFGSPVRVNDAVGTARLNGEQPPQIGLVRRPNGEPGIVVVWTLKGAQGTELRQASSTDGGRSFSASTLVPGSDAAGNRGWEAANVESSGRVAVVWLDHRELASDPGMAASHHQHASADKPDGVAMAQKSKLFFATLDASVAPKAITGGVCYCCKTALASSGNTIFAAWRHVYPGNLRDMAFSMSRDDGRTFSAPLRVSEDRWMLEGCPDDGPSMAVDGKKRVHLAWPTLVAGEKSGEPTIGIFYAMSDDGNRFTPRQRLPTEGVPHHPRLVMTADGTLVAAWDESTGGARRIAVATATVGSTGQPQFHRLPALPVTGPGVYPALAAAGRSVVLAWTSGGSAESSIRVQTLGASDARTNGAF